MKLVAALVAFLLAALLARVEVMVLLDSRFALVKPFDASVPWYLHGACIFFVISFALLGLGLLESHSSKSGKDPFEDYVNVQSDWGPSGGHDPGGCDPSDSYRE